MDHAASLRQHVLKLLTVPQAHRTFDDAVAAMPAGRRGDRPEPLPYSVWELVEHIRRAQRDILEYCQDPGYEHRDWPEAYWPDGPVPPNESAWTEAVDAVQDDRDALCDLLREDDVDLYDTVPSSEEHTYLRELLLVADHTAYHVGQIVAVRRALDLWPPKEG